MSILNRSGLRIPLAKAQDLLPMENLALLDEKD